jgi:ABC-type nitrate/sulfonate/bicarbonate transport system substrate-binding protein
MRVLITGATTWTDDAALRHAMSALPVRTTVVTGETPGIDALALSIAQELGFAVEPMKKTRGDRRAYPDASWKGLNERMLATGIDAVLAFHPDYGKPGCARGTVHMVELAQAAGVKTHIFLR